MRPLVKTTMMAMALVGLAGIALSQAANAQCCDSLSCDGGGSCGSSCNQSYGRPCNGGLWDNWFGSSGGSGGCDSCDSGCDSCCGKSKPSCGMKISTFSDILFMDRDSPSNLGNGGLVSRGGTTLLDNDDLDPSDETGYRVGMFLHKNDCLAYEVAYLSNEWDNQRRFRGTNDLDAIAGTIDFTLADQIDVRYQSEIRSFEANRWKAVNSNVDWMIGFRYFSLEESFDMVSQDSGFTSNYSIDTENDLFGAQLGGRHQKSFYCNSLSLSLTGKAGVYGNDPTQTVLLRDVDSTIATRSFSNKDGVTSFIGEIDANATFWLSSNLAARVGYQLMWIDGVALAPEQFQQDATIADAALNNSGELFLNGVYVGIQSEW